METMQLTVEHEMKASRHPLHGKQRGAGRGLRGGEQGGAVTKTLARLSYLAGHSERDGGLRPEASRLASLAGANRAQLAVLTEAEVTAGLREGVTGVTCLASVRPVAPRLTAAPIVLARGPGSSAVQARDVDTQRGDEGGIYSW